MRKSLLLILVVFYTSVCFSQSVGDIFSQGAAQQGTPDCSDPAMSRSPQCAGAQSQKQGGGQAADVSSLPLRTPVLTSPEEASPEQFAPNAPQNPSQATRAQMAPKPETEFEQMVADSVGHVLPLFGQSLFVQVPSTFAPVDQMQVPSDYVVGPGDELQIKIWGQVEANLRVVVDRSGQIYVPRVGEISVAGLHYGDLEENLRREVSKIFKNFNLTVNIGRLRTIQIYVVGDARYPGTYTISSLSTLVNAMFASGGPAPQGSLRHIQVRRDGATITDFDFYDLLIKGDKSKDVRLASGDVLYIPHVGPLVAISGSVNTPAIYEIRNNSTLSDLLEIAGDLSTVADTNKITIDRVEEHHARRTLEFPFDEQSRTEALKDGDIVHVFSIVPQFVDTVTLRGNVANPGRYPWKPGMRIRDLIPDSQALLTRNYWRDRAAVVNGRATEYPVRTQEPHTVRPEYQPYQQQIGNPTQQGENPNPAAVNSANGNAPSYPVQMSPNGTGAAVVGQNVQGFPPSQQQNVANANRIQQEPQTMGTLGTTPNIVRDIAEDVRRYAPEINWDYAIIQRVNPIDLSSKLIWMSPRRAIIEKDEQSNLELQAGDIVTIFSQSDISVPRADRSQYVIVEGEVMRPGIYKLEANETLRALLQRAGGLTPDAYVYGTQFTRESARIDQQKSIDELARSMDVQIRQSATTIAASANPGDLNQMVAAQTAIVNTLRNTRASGRVALTVRPKDKSIGDYPDLVLEDRDRVMIPNTPSTVSVVGNVYNPGSFIFEPRNSAGSYLQVAGKGKPQSDLHHAFVLRANGFVVAANDVNGLFTGSKFERIRLYPGDQIVVPYKLPTGAFVRGLRDWTQIASQLALTAAALAVIAP
jgi:protein involved in polysaccharide export with SLBB domain